MASIPEVAETPIWEEPVRGFFIDPARFLKLSGLEVMRDYLEGARRPPPIHYLTGLIPTFVGPGAATFTMPVSDWLLSPQGVVSGATLGLLVDGPLGTTVQTTLPPATPYTTAELSMYYLRTVTRGAGQLTGRGRLLSAGRTVGLSEVEVTDQAGRPVAIATTRCVVLPKIDVEAPAELPALDDEPEWPTPHPYQRPVQGEVLPQEVWDRMSGLEVMRAIIAGELPAPPIHHLCGIAPVSAEEGATTWRLPASEWLCAPIQGRVFGGATTYLAGTAIDGAIQTVVPAGTAFAPVDLKVYFLRPVAPDGRDLIATSRVTQRGRTVVIGTSEVRDADGKLVVMATGSAMLMPGRPATVTSRS
ncbi:MAG TPA: PaaI family thioesterase [Candidatus Dormibacteraeota bacterium]